MAESMSTRWSAGCTYAGAMADSMANSGFACMADSMAESMPARPGDSDTSDAGRSFAQCMADSMADSMPTRSNDANRNVGIDTHKSIESSDTNKSVESSDADRSDRRRGA